MRYAVILAGLLLLMASAARGESEITPAGADPDFKPIAADATVDQVLDSLKSRGDSLHDFSADVTMTTVDNSTANSSAESGNVKFQKLNNGDGRIRVAFDKSTQGNKDFPEKHEYTLDGGWLTDRDYLKQIEVRRQVVRPGQKINLLKLGEGPFPLPIGQDKDDVKKLFDVTLGKPDKTNPDPAGSVHIVLTPKAGSDFARKFTQIEVWVDRKVGMPVRIATTDNTGDQTRTTDLTNIRINQGLGDKDFALPKLESGWTQTEEPYHEERADSAELQGTDVSSGAEAI